MDDILALIGRVHQGDKEARDILVEKNMGLVRSIVKRFQNRGVETEDLLQTGSIGLLKAIDKFDLEYDVKFSTYAIPMISGEIRRFLRDDGMLKVSRSLKELSYKTMQAGEKLAGRLGREPTLEELSAELGVECEELAEALEAGAAVDSIDRPVRQKEGSEVCLADRIEEKKGNVDDIIDRMLLEQLLGTLTAEERRLIWLRYFSGRTQSEVGRMLGISQVQVSRAEKRIMEKLRKRGET